MGGMVRTGRWENTLVRESQQEKKERLRSRLAQLRSLRGGGTVAQTDADPHCMPLQRPIGIPASSDVDLLRPSVRTSIFLGREAQRSEREKANDMAIGGMRLPRKPLQKLPMHRTLGAKVAYELETYLH